MVGYLDMVPDTVHHVCLFMCSCNVLGIHFKLLFFSFISFTDGDSERLHTLHAECNKTSVCDDIVNITCLFPAPYKCILIFRLLVVHHSLFIGDRSAASRRHSSVTRVQQQQQMVARQRLQQAEQAGFKPIDKPSATKKPSSTTFGGSRVRHQSTGGVTGGARRSSESSSNPLSGDEYY
jgi:hypothetical protein